MNTKIQQRDLQVVGEVDRAFFSFLPTNIAQTVFPFFERMKDSIVLAMPLSYRLVYTAGREGYRLSKKVSSFFSPPQELNIPGLDPEVGRYLKSHLVSKLQDQMRFVEKFFPGAVQKTSSVGLEKMAHHLLEKALSNFPEELLKKVQRSQVDALMNYGLSYDFYGFAEHIVKEKGSAYLEEFFVEIITKFAPASISGWLKDQEIIEREAPKLYFQVREKEGGTFDLIYFRSEEVTVSVLDQKKESRVYVFRDVCKEKLKGLSQVIEPFYEGSENPTLERFCDLSQILRNYLEVKPQIQFRRVREDKIFGGDPDYENFFQEMGSFLEESKTEELLYSCMVQEKVGCFLQKEPFLNSSDLAKLKSQVAHLKTEIANSRQTDANHLISILEELIARIEKKWDKTVEKEILEKKNHPFEQSLFPKVLWPLYDFFFEKASSSSPFFKKIHQGVERALGESYQNLSKAIEKEYLKHKASGEKVKTSSLEMFFAVIITGFIHFYLLDLICLFLGTVFPTQTVVAAILQKGVAFFAASEMKALLPQKYREIYDKVFVDVAFFWLPYFIEGAYKLFVPEKTQKEIEENVLFLDLCTFKENFKKAKEDPVDQEVDQEEIPSKAAEFIQGMQYRKRLSVEEFDLEEEAASEEGFFNKALYEGLSIEYPSQSSKELTHKRMECWYQLLHRKKHLSEEEKKFSNCLRKMMEREDFSKNFDFSKESVVTFQTKNEALKRTVVRKLIREQINKYVKKDSKSSLPETFESTTHDLLLIQEEIEKQLQETDKTSLEKGLVGPLQDKKIGEAVRSLERREENVKDAYVTILDSLEKFFEVLDLQQIKVEAEKEEKLLWVPKGLLTQKIATEESVQLALQKLNEIQEELPLQSLQDPAQLNAYLEQVRENSLKQLKVLYAFPLEQNSFYFVFLVGKLERNLYENLAKIPFFKEGSWSSLFSSKNWTEDQVLSFMENIRDIHELLHLASIPVLKNLSHNLSGITGNQDSLFKVPNVENPAKLLYLSCLYKAAEFLLQREPFNYPNFHLGTFFQTILVEKGEIDYFSLEERKLLDVLCSLTSPEDLEEFSLLTGKSEVTRLSSSKAYLTRRTRGDFVESLFQKWRKSFFKHLPKALLAHVEKKIYLSERRCYKIDHNWPVIFSEDKFVFNLKKELEIALKKEEDHFFFFKSLKKIEGLKKAILWLEKNKTLVPRAFYHLSQPFLTPFIRNNNSPYTFSVWLYGTSLENLYLQVGSFTENLLLFEENASFQLLREKKNRFTSSFETDYFNHPSAFVKILTDLKDFRDFDKGLAERLESLLNNFYPTYLELKRNKELIKETLFLLQNVEGRNADIENLQKRVRLIADIYHPDITKDLGAFQTQRRSFYVPPIEAEEKELEELAVNWFFSSLDSLETIYRYNSHFSYYLQKIQDPRFQQRLVREFFVRGGHFLNLDKYNIELLPNFGFLDTKAPFARLYRQGNLAFEIYRNGETRTFKRPAKVRLPAQSTGKKEDRGVKYVKGKPYIEVSLKNIGYHGLQAYFRKEKGEIHLRVYRKVFAQKEVFLEEVALPSGVRLERLQFSEKPPYFYYPSENQRLPLLLSAFSRGKRVEILESSKNRLFLITGAEDQVIFEEEEGLIKCQKFGGYVCWEQHFPQTSLFGNALVIRKGGENFLLYERAPLLVLGVGTFLGSLSSYLESTVSKALPLIPELRSIIEQIRENMDSKGFKIVPLDSNNEVVDLDIEELLRALLISYDSDEKVFQKHAQKLQNELEMQSLSLKQDFLGKTLIILAFSQYMNRKPLTHTTVMKLLISYLPQLFLQKTKVPIEEKFLLHFLLFLLYAEYQKQKLYKHFPLDSSEEYVFLLQFFCQIQSLFEEMKFSTYLEKISREAFFYFFSTLLDGNLLQRIEVLSRKYPQPGNDLAHSFQRLMRAFFVSNQRGSARFTPEQNYSCEGLAFRGGKFLRDILIKAVAKRAILPDISWEEFPESPKKIYSKQDLRDLDLERVHSDFRKYAQFVLATNVDNLSNFFPSKERITKEEMLLLQQTMRKNLQKVPKEEKHLPFLGLLYLFEANPKELESLRIKIEYRNIRKLIYKKTSARIPVIGRVIRNKITWLQDQAMLAKKGLSDWKSVASIAYQVSFGYLPAPSRHLIFYAEKVVNGVGGLSSPLSSFRKFRELSMSYGCYSSLVEEYLVLKRCFTQMEDTFFTKEQEVGEVCLQIPSPYGENSLEYPYFSWRITDSQQAKISRRKERIKARDLSREEGFIKQILHFKRALENESKELERQVQTILKKRSLYHLEVEDLFSLLLETDYQKQLEIKVRVNESTAQLMASRLIQLALYQSYLVKLALVEDAWKKGASFEELGTLFCEPKNYPLGEGENPRFSIGCVIFEAQNKMWLRSLQASQLEKALSASEKGVVIEMIPGSGKTAFGVVLNLFYAWSPEKLPLAVFTNALVASQKKELRQRFELLTKRKASFFSISRERETLASLNHLLHKMEQAKNTGNVLITTKESLQGLELLFVEALFQKEPFFSKRVPVLEKILSVIFQDSIAAVDECHEVLRPDEIEKYPVGRELFLQPSWVRSCEVVFRMLLEATSENSVSLAEALKDPIKWKALLQKLPKKLARYPLFEVSKKERREQLEEYFSSLEKAPPNWLKQDKHFPGIASARGVLLEFLPSSFLEKVHVSYGVSKKNREQSFVIPYASNNTPIEDAIFESPFETLSKTYLYFLQVGLTSMQASDVLVKFKKILAKERGRGIQEEDSWVLAFLQEHLGKKKSVYDYLGEDLRKVPAIILFYVSEIVAPTIKFYQSSIDSNSSNFASMLEKAFYYSGTISNRSVYPEDLAYCRIEETCWQTLEAIHKGLNNGKIIFSKEENPEQDFIEQALLDKANVAIIDTGALFNGRSNREVARNLLRELENKRPEIKGVLYFDLDNQMYILNKDRERIPFPNGAYHFEELFTYLDQRHFYGVDLPFVEGSGAFATIGDNTLSDLEQTAWRLRGLETKGQRLSFYLLPSVDNTLTHLGVEERGFGQIVHYLVHQEREKLLRQNYQASLQKMENLIRSKLIRKMVIKGKSQEIFSKVSSLFVSEKEIDPSQLFGRKKEEKGAFLVLKDQIERWTQKIVEMEVLEPEEKEGILQELNSLLGKNLSSFSEKLLPKKVWFDTSQKNVAPSGRVKQKVQVKQNTQSQTHTHMEVDVHTQIPHPNGKNFSLNTPKEYLSWPENLDLTSLNWMEQSPVEIDLRSSLKDLGDDHWAKFSTLLSKSIYYSKNILPQRPVKTYPDKFFHTIFEAYDYQTWKEHPVHLLVMKENSQVKTVGLSSADSLFWEKTLRKKGCKHAEITYGIYDLELRCLIEGGDHFAGKDKDELEKQALDWKIFNLKRNFTYKERIWIQEKIEKALKENPTLSRQELEASTRKVVKYRARSHQDLPSSLIFFIQGDVLEGLVSSYSYFL